MQLYNIWGHEGWGEMILWSFILAQVFWVHVSYATYASSFFYYIVVFDVVKLGLKFKFSYSVSMLTNIKCWLTFNLTQPFAVDFSLLHGVCLSHVDLYETELPAFYKYLRAHLVKRTLCPSVMLKPDIYQRRLLGHCLL